MDFKTIRPILGNGKKLHIETYGCQMNFGDSEIVVSIMQKEGFFYTDKIEEADIILINTCSIRDNAEKRIWGRLKEFNKYKKLNRKLIVGVIGCMAKRLNEELIEKSKIVDVVVGPDSYRDLPDLVRSIRKGVKGVSVVLSQEETYADIDPVRLDKNGVSAFIAIMRGCNNMCSYCVVPYTRGIERSRNPQTIIDEAKTLFESGYKEVTLLGQNVNSYGWTKTEGGVMGFPDLLKRVADISPQLRVRFSTSHPKDLSDEVLKIMVSMPNICRAIHLPAQSGSSRMLELMNRKYSREWYLDRMYSIRKYLPDCSITTDVIAGFCGETEEDHKETISLMNEVGYDFAYMYKYSERPNTKAQRTMVDDVPEDVKTARLSEIIDLQQKLSLESNKKDIGKCFEVLVEGVSKRSDTKLYGRTSQNKVLIFDRKDYKIGDYVMVNVTECSSATLKGESI